MTTQPSFEYKERIGVFPFNGGKAQVVMVRLETDAKLSLKGSSSDDAVAPAAATPFSIEALFLLQEFQASRILIQTGSSSSSSFQHYGNHVPPPSSHNSDGNEEVRSDVGPSGVSVMVRFVNNDYDESIMRERFSSLLGRLEEERIILAPLDSSVSLKRLHRWVHVKRLAENNEWELQVVLPNEGASMTSEGMVAFLSSLSPCCKSQKGIMAIASAEPVSGVLMGTSPQVAPAVRRTTWIDLTLSCHENDSSVCNMHVNKGIQYGVKAMGTGQQPMALSNLLPGESSISNPVLLQACPVADSTVLRQTVQPEKEFTTILENGVLLNDVTVPAFTLQHHSNGISIHSTLQRPRGVANTGTLVTLLENTHTECAAVANLTMVLPSIVRPLFTTLQIQTETSSGVIVTCDVWKNHCIKDMQHHEILFHEDGSVVMQFEGLQLESSLKVSVEYDPVLLPFEHFPGDPNRGIELFPSMAVFSSSCLPDHKLRLCSNSLLLMPPVPDMSMPFNVISLTCTLYAFLFGSLLNLLVRKSSERVQNTYKNKAPEKSKLRTEITRQNCEQIV